MSLGMLKCRTVTIAGDKILHTPIPGLPEYTAEAAFRNQLLKNIKYEY